jgi:hypothetical protein
LVSSTFTIDQGILEKTLEFAPGQWLLSSYIATGMENVPIFISADNSETELRSILDAPTKPNTAPRSRIAKTSSVPING